jgi:hypothetical protein
VRWKAGFNLGRATGSHHIMRHSDSEIPPCRCNLVAADVAEGTLCGILVPCWWPAHEVPKAAADVGLVLG